MMTKKQITFWRLIILVLLFGGSVLVGRCLHKKPLVDSSKSKAINSNKNNISTSKEVNDGNVSSAGTTENLDSFDDDFKDDEKGVDSIDKNNSPVEKVTTLDEKEIIEEEPIEVDQTINLNIRSKDFFDFSEEDKEEKTTNL